MSLPPEKAVRDLLTALLTRKIDLHPGDPVPTSPVDLFTVGVYATARLETVALVACDLQSSAYLGCALSLLPAAAVRDGVSDKKLSDEIIDNLHEVLNVGATMFNRKDAAHVKLHHVYRPDEALPTDVRAWLGRPGGRLDLSADVLGYGRGLLSIIDTEV